MIPTRSKINLISLGLLPLRAAAAGLRCGAVMALGLRSTRDGLGWDWDTDVSRPVVVAEAQVSRISFVELGWVALVESTTPSLLFI